MLAGEVGRPRAVSTKELLCLRRKAWSAGGWEYDTVGLQRYKHMQVVL